MLNVLFLITCMQERGRIHYLEDLLLKKWNALPFGLSLKVKTERLSSKYCQFIYKTHILVAGKIRGKNQGNTGGGRRVVKRLGKAVGDMDFIRAPCVRVPPPGERALFCSLSLAQCSCHGFDLLERQPPVEAAGQGLSKDKEAFWCADRRTGQTPRCVRQSGSGCVMI